MRWRAGNGYITSSPLERNPPCLRHPRLTDTTPPHEPPPGCVVILAHLDSKETERKVQRKGWASGGGGLKTSAPKTCRQLYPELKKWQS